MLPQVLGFIFKNPIRTGYCVEISTQPGWSLQAGKGWPHSEHQEDHHKQAQLTMSIPLSKPIAPVLRLSLES